MNPTKEELTNVLNQTKREANYNLRRVRAGGLNDEPCICPLSLMLAEYSSEQIEAISHFVAVFFTALGPKLDAPKINKLLAHTDAELKSRGIESRPIPLTETKTH